VNQIIPPMIKAPIIPRMTMAESIRLSFLGSMSSGMLVAVDVAPVVDDMDWVQKAGVNICSVPSRAEALG